MTLKQEQEQELIINDLFLIAKAVKEHLKEPNCTHNIRSIVKQALEDKTSVAYHTTDNRTGITIPGTNQDGYREQSR